MKRLCFSVVLKLNNEEGKVAIRLKLGYNKINELITGWIVMSLAEKLIKDFEQLPEDKKREVIDFVEFLKAKTRNEVENLMDVIIADNTEALKELSRWWKPWE